MEVSSSILPVREDKLKELIGTATNQSLQYCDRKLKGSKEMRQRLRKRLSMALENEAERMQRRNENQIECMKAKFYGVLCSVAIFELYNH